MRKAAETELIQLNATYTDQIWLHSMQHISLVSNFCMSGPSILLKNAETNNSQGVSMGMTPTAVGWGLGARTKAWEAAHLPMVVRDFPPIIVFWHSSTLSLKDQSLRLVKMFAPM